MKISFVIITFNEQKNIEKCLKSIISVADEIIVVDSFSTDDTKEICQKFNCRFYENKFENYSAQKNYANSLVIFDYIFSIDADEVLSEELINSINKLKTNNLITQSFQVQRLNNYCGKWIKHGGWYPDIKTRMWKNNTATWKGEIHETLVFDTKMPAKLLKGNLLHYSYYSIDQHILQANKFSTLSAKMLYEKGKKVNFLQILLKPFWKFLRNYFFKGGFLDSYYGFVISIISAHETFLKYSKLKQLTENKNAKNN
jgi:glycosyltransferase involved in cell wall biosynthesis